MNVSAETTELERVRLAAGAVANYRDRTDRLTRRLNRLADDLDADLAMLDYHTDQLHQAIRTAVAAGAAASEIAAWAPVTAGQVAAIAAERQ